DLIGLVEEAKAAAQAGQKATMGQMDLASARHSLIACHERVNSASQRFYSELVSFEALQALSSLVNEQRMVWHQWVSGVKDALDRCRQPIDNVNQALFQCWQEISERAGLVSASVEAARTGQPINITSEKGSQT